MSIDTVRETEAADADDSAADSPDGPAGAPLSSWVERLRVGRRRAKRIAMRPRQVLRKVHRWASLGLSIGVVVLAISGFWKVIDTSVANVVREDSPTTAEAGSGTDVGWTQAETVGRAGLDKYFPDVELSRGPIWPPDEEWWNLYWLDAYDSDGGFYYALVDPTTGTLVAATNDAGDGLPFDEGGNPGWITSIDEFMSRAHYTLWQDSAPLAMMSDGGWCEATLQFDEETEKLFTQYSKEPGAIKRAACTHVVGPFLTGTNLAATVAFGWLITTAIGLYLWYFPGVKRWRRVARVRSRRGLFTFNLDLHKALGITTLVILVPFMVSGMLFADTFARQTTSVMRTLTPAPAESEVMVALDDVVSTAAPTARPVEPDDVVEAFRADHPRAAIKIITPPLDESGVWKVEARDGFSFRYADLAVSVDQYSGAVVDTSSESQAGLSDQAIESLVPYHIEQWGGGWQIALMTFGTGLAPLALAVTGTMMTLQRMRKRRNRARRVDNTVGDGAVDVGDPVASTEIPADVAAESVETPA